MKKQIQNSLDNPRRTYYPGWKKWKRQEDSKKRKDIKI